jgi:hypothetical protein
MIPRVFISHASEDKERFVLKFAEVLRAKGIDAWLDKWEILPGDSLIDKIFEEGIKNAHAVIVVLSSHSINKPWVREELNAAAVKRINGLSKLIPIVIDECQVPEVLQSSVWVKINDLNSYEADLDRVVLAIYDHREKPKLGSQPAYTRTIVDFIPGVSNIDNLVFKLFCEKIIDNEYGQLGSPAIYAVANSIDLPLGEFSDTLQVLHTHGYINGAWTADGTMFSLSITPRGFELYAKAHVKDYSSIVQDVIFQFVNHGNTQDKAIAKALNQPEIIVSYILSLLEQKGLIRVSWSNVGGEVTGISPELKRKLRRSE